MKIEISAKFFGQENSRIYSLPKDSQIYDLLDKLDQNPETVVVKVDERIVPEDEKLADGDEVEIIPIASGG